MKVIILTAAMFLLVGSVAAQSLERSVIGAAGAYSTAGNVKLSSTIGEPVIATAESGTITLTQGFQQPDGFTTGIKDPEVNIDYLLYPNPTVDVIQLVLTAPEWECAIQLTDALGKVIEQRNEVVINGKQTERFDLHNLAAGQYYITLVSNSKIVKTFKVQKID
jgi:hypothetical protein